MNRWKYGNIRLVRNLIGDQIDLFKNNLERLVLSNVAKGKETTLKEISEILLEFCKYILSPSIEKLGELNKRVKELPYTKYEVLTKKQRVSKYFYGRPRFSRLLFAFCVAIPIAVVLLCLGQSMGVIFAVAVTSFWGAFMGFEKLFRSEEK